MIENHVIRLELADNLKNLGVNKNSLFIWQYDNKNEKWDCWLHDSGEKEDDDIAAYTASEILEMLPDEVKFPSYEEYNNFRLEITKIEDDSYDVRYFNTIHGIAVMISGHLLNILPHMLIYLIENNLIDMDKIK